MRNQDPARYQRAKRFLMRRTNYETFASIPYERMVASLARLREFVEFIGSPQNEYALVHVAGTKGKGTVCAALDQVWRASGYRVGVFASPHLDDLTERFQIDGVPCDKNLFADTVAMLVERWKAFRKMRRSKRGEAAEFESELPMEAPGMTFFEWTLVIALTLFARARVDIAILEVGMGGRFDATNVCFADLSILTSISYDHCDQLGHTLPEIAAEKLGIVKSNAPLVSGIGFSAFLSDGFDEFREHEKEALGGCVPSPDESADGATSERRKFDDALDKSARNFAFLADPETVVTRADVDALRVQARKVAEEHGAPFYQVETLSPRVAALPTPPFDSVRKWNFEIAMRAADVLSTRTTAPENRPGAEEPESVRRFPLTDSAFRTAAENFSIPARFEVVSVRPLVIVDGAHNRASVAAFLKGARERFPDRKIRVLFAVSLGKDARGMLAELAAGADEIILTERSRDPRSTPLADLIQIHEELLDETAEENASVRRKFRVAPDFRAFLTDYCARPSVSGDVMCAIGSFYFAAEVRRMLKKQF